jgi:hypothetical protein
MAIYTESERRDAAALGEDFIIRTCVSFRLFPCERIRSGFSRCYGDIHHVQEKMNKLRHAPQFS